MSSSKKTLAVNIRAGAGRIAFVPIGFHNAPTRVALGLSHQSVSQVIREPATTLEQLWNADSNTHPLLGNIVLP